MTVVKPWCRLIGKKKEKTKRECSWNFSNTLLVSILKLLKLTWLHQWQPKELRWGSSVYISGMHTVAIWTLTFHKISGFVRVILKANFKQFYIQAKGINFLTWKFQFIILIFLLFLQMLSNPVLFAHCWCYFEKIESFESHVCVKLQFSLVQTQLKMSEEGEIRKRVVTSSS